MVRAASGWDLVAAGSAGFVDPRCFPRILREVVGSVPGAVAGDALAGHDADLFGESGDGESVG